MKRSERNKVKAHADQEHPDPDNTSGGKYERHIDGNINVRGGIETTFPPDLIEKHDAEREEDSAQDRKKFMVEIITLMFVIVVAGLTGLQVYYTRKAITDTGAQFQTDQRPYLWDSNVTDPTNVKIEAGRRMWINISLINFGKAPALNARGIATIFIGTNAMHDADGWFAAFGERPLPDDPNDTGIVVPPGIPSGEITAKSAFGGGGYFTPMSEKVLTQDEVNYILHSNEKIAIVVHTQYFDAYGTRYWTNFCLTRFDTGTYPHCNKHNEIH